MSGVVVDTSVWIEFFAGAEIPVLEEALARGAVILAPVVAAELLSGARRPGEREALTALVADLDLHPTPLAHWLRVGDLRRRLAERGLSVSTPDAHVAQVAQVALDRNSPLLARDGVFARIAEVEPLKLPG